MGRIVAHRCSLVCFPHAGGDPRHYAAFARVLQPHVNVYCIELPGRGRRIRESCFTCLDDVIDALLDRLDEWPRGPFVLSGHSMGGFVAFEFARGLRRLRHRPPEAIIVSNCRAPHLRVSHPLSDLGDEQFLEQLGQLAGMSLAHLDAELLDLVLPALRADVRLCERYRHEDDVPLDSPIYTFRAEMEPWVTSDEVHAWSCHTRRGFVHSQIAGGHMNLAELADAVVSTLPRVLGSESANASRLLP